jgi:hypothetical protein
LKKNKKTKGRRMKKKIKEETNKPLLLINEIASPKNVHFFFSFQKALLWLTLYDSILIRRLMRFGHFCINVTKIMK